MHHNPSEPGKEGAGRWGWGRDSVWETKAGISEDPRFSLPIQTRLDAPVLGTCIWPVMQFVPGSLQAVGWGLLPWLMQTAGNDSWLRGVQESHGLLPRLEAIRRPLPGSGGSKRN